MDASSTVGDPNVNKSMFWRHFVDEMKNQFKGTPTESAPTSKTTSMTTTKMPRKR